MNRATWNALCDELTKLAEQEAYGDSTDYRGTQTNDGPPVQEWQRRGRLPGRQPVRLKKEADLKSTILKGTNVLKNAPKKLNELSQKGMARLQTHPIGKRVVDHVMDPANTSDLAMTLGKLF